MMKKGLGRGTTRLLIRVMCAFLGAMLICTSPVRVLALTPAEEKAQKRAEEAANKAYQDAIAEGMDDSEAMAEAQRASEEALNNSLPYYEEYEEQAAENAKQLEEAQAAQKAAEEALQNQTSAILEQTQALEEISDMVEALGKKEEEEGASVIKVAETKTSHENPCITWFVKGIDQKVKESEAFIGSRSIEIADSGKLGAGAGPAPKTLLLVDNSNSVSKYKDKIKTILTRLVWNHQPEERFSLVAFGEEINVLLDFTDNYDDVRMAIDKMTYKDQSTYLRNILYDEIKAMNDDGEDDFNRIIIISDGTEESRLGVTYEELTDLIKSDIYKCPIYTIGCHYQPAVGDLDKLFALSRRSSSPYFALDDYEDVNQIADIIREDDKSIRFFRFSVPDDLRDGSTKTIGLHLVYEESDYMFAHSTQVPIASADVLKQVAEDKKLADEKAKEENAALRSEIDSLREAGENKDKTEEVTESQTDDTGDTQNPDDYYYDDEDYDMTFRDVMFYYIYHNALWISLIFIIINFAYIGYKNRHTKKVRKVEEEEKNEEAVAEELSSDINSAIYLFETSRPDVRYPIKIGEEKIIGRSRARCDITFPTDKAMSARQACIRVEAGDETKAVLENLDTQGGTSVDGQVVQNDITLRNGARIKLGSTILEVRYE